MVSSLEKIGIKVKPRELASSAAYTTIQTVKNKIPIALNAGWGKDYADAYTFAGALFDSRSIIATGNTNYPLQGMTSEQAKSLGIAIPSGRHHPERRRRHRRLPGDRPRPAGPAQPVLRRPGQEDHGGRRSAGCPYLWAKNITVTGTTVTKCEFDQFSGYLSYTQMAVNNNETIPS